MVDYDVFQIEPPTQVKQELLIRHRVKLSHEDSDFSDGAIDHIEDRVNSIVVANRIVPRYPFFILCILQTYESYMPDNLSISSYGHCYHALIVAMLIKAGVRQTDSDVNACFNFAEHLAFEIYRKGGYDSVSSEEIFGSFVKRYNKKFILRSSMLNRLRNSEYGIILRDGRFRHRYMYYFFLGRFFARHADEYEEEVLQICDSGHIGDNHVILLFIIHHTNDESIIEEIMLRTMCALDDFKPAVLTDSETRRFANILTTIPRNILSDNSVEEERKWERVGREARCAADEKALEGPASEKIGWSKTYIKY